MKRILLATLFAAIGVCAAYGQQMFTAADLIAARRVGDPQLSPDGKTVAFTIAAVDKVANRTLNRIYEIGTDGSKQREITPGSSPRWSSDGKWLAYVAGGQIWVMRPDGSDKKQITKISTGAGGPVWSPDGKWIAFGSD